MLQPLAPELWEVEHDLFLPGGLHFRGRMVVVRLPDGGLLLHSAVPIDDALADQLAALGPVRHIVAPSKLHHLHLGAARARYPQAATWGAPGLAEKVPGLPLDHVLGAEAPPWAASFRPHLVAGIPWMNEVVFHHAESRSLVLTDLFFHVHEVANWQSRLLFRLYGLLGKAGQSPLVRFQTRDRAAAGASLRPLLDLDLDRAIPAHGRVLEGDLKAELARILAWPLAAAPAPALAQSST